MNHRQDAGDQRGTGIPAGHSVLQLTARRQGAVLIGLAASELLSMIMGDLAESFLLGVTPHDASIALIVIGILLTSSPAATLLPAWRVARRHPLEVLRAE